jgi:hypothetical protein
MLPSPQCTWIDAQTKGKFLLAKSQSGALSDDLLTKIVNWSIVWSVTQEFDDSGDISKLWVVVVDLPVGDG